MDTTGPHSWENAPFRNQPATFTHTLVYVLGDCLRALKTDRDRTSPTTAHHNLQLVILACSFVEASLSRGLVNAAMHRLAQLPRTPESNQQRKELADAIDSLVDGSVYGNPFGKELRPGPYSAFVRLILGVDLTHQIPKATASAVRCLFLLRNIAVHGQTVSATGVFPDRFDDPIANCRPRPTEKFNELEAHLRTHNLLQPMTLKSGVGFPFLNDAVTDHFLRALVEFFRALQKEIVGDDLRHEFGDGIPQNIFQILAGEAFEM